MKNTFVFWTFLSKELIDLKTVIESLFENLSLSRDYEDTWEWLEGKSADDIFDINVSRKHNWKTGDYKNELVFIVKTDKDLNVDELGRCLQKELGSTFYYGQRSNEKGNEYNFEIEKEYN